MSENNWEVAIVMYMLHLNMSREQACKALGISFRDAPSDTVITRNRTFNSCTPMYEYI